MLSQICIINFNNEIDSTANKTHSKLCSWNCDMKSNNDPEVPHQLPWKSSAEKYEGTTMLKWVCQEFSEPLAFTYISAMYIYMVLNF